MADDEDTLIGRAFFEQAPELDDVGGGCEGVAVEDFCLVAGFGGDELSGLQAALERAGDDEVELQVHGLEEVGELQGVALAVFVERALEVQEGVHAAGSGAGMTKDVEVHFWLGVEVGFAGVWWKTPGSGSAREGTAGSGLGSASCTGAGGRVRRGSLVVCVVHRGVRNDCSSAAPPKLGVEDAAEALMVEDSLETGGCERGLRIRQMRDGQAGEDAEGQVEGTDVKAGYGAERAGGGDAEIGKEPEGAGFCGRGEVAGKLVDFELRKAVEEEVGDDEVGLRGRRDVEGVDLFGEKAVSSQMAAFTKQTEHSGARVDGRGVKIRVLLEESGDEAAVAIAEDNGVAGSGYSGKEVRAGALEKWAEGEVLGPAVEAGYAVEVGGGRHRRKRIGVRRARSAAARSVRGANL